MNDWLTEAVVLILLLIMMSTLRAILVTLRQIQLTLDESTRESITEIANLLLPRRNSGS